MLFQTKKSSPNFLGHKKPIIVIMKRNRPVFYSKNYSKNGLTSATERYDFSQNLSATTRPTQTEVKLNRGTGAYLLRFRRPNGKKPAVAVATFNQCDGYIFFHRLSPALLQPFLWPLSRYGPDPYSGDLPFQKHYLHSSHGCDQLRATVHA